MNITNEQSGNDINFEETPSNDSMTSIEDILLKRLLENIKIETELEDDNNKFNLETYLRVSLLYKNQVITSSNVNITNT